MNNIIVLDQTNIKNYSDLKEPDMSNFPPSNVSSDRVLSRRDRAVKATEQERPASSFSSSKNSQPIGDR